MKPFIRTCLDLIGEYLVDGLRYDELVFRLESEMIESQMPDGAFRTEWYKFWEDLEFENAIVLAPDQSAKDFIGRRTERHEIAEKFMKWLESEDRSRAA